MSDKVGLNRYSAPLVILRIMPKLLGIRLALLYFDHCCTALSIGIVFRLNQPARQLTQASEAMREALGA